MHGMQALYAVPRTSVVLHSRIVDAISEQSWDMDRTSLQVRQNKVGMSEA